MDKISEFIRKDKKKGGGILIRVRGGEVL